MIEGNITPTICDSLTPQILVQLRKKLVASLNIRQIETIFMS
jgi:hypothetical protein